MPVWVSIFRLFIKIFYTDFKESKMKKNKRQYRARIPASRACEKECATSTRMAFEIDGGVSGSARKLQCAETLSGRITVPFCRKQPFRVATRTILPSVGTKRKSTDGKELSDGKRSDNPLRRLRL